MEAITKATGSTVLSCEHAFHFRCIDSWFTKQVCDDIAQTCPCCRSSGCEMDRCSLVEMAEDEEDDDETYAEGDAESQTADDMPNDEEMEDIRWERLGPGRWIITTSHELAMEGVRNLFGPLNQLDAKEEDPRDAAVRKIQAIFRGHKTRETFYAARMLMTLFA